MNRETVIQLAREAGFTVGFSSPALEKHERFAKAIEQRTLNAALERAAQVADDHKNDCYEYDLDWHEAGRIAAAIRALSDRMTVITVPIKHKD